MTGPHDYRLTEGTVIDHLPVGTAARAMELLGLPREGPVTIGINVPSPSQEKKDIVPDRLRGILSCRNPTCITNAEQVPTVFLKKGAYPHRFQCAYCERISRGAELRP